MPKRNVEPRYDGSDVDVNADLMLSSAQPLHESVHPIVDEEGQVYAPNAQMINSRVEQTQ